MDNAKTVAKRGGNGAKAGGGADQSESRQIKLESFSRRAFADDNIQFEVLHGRIKDFFNKLVEAVNFINEKDIAVREIGENRAQIAHFFNRRAGSGANAGARFIGDDMSESRFAKAGGAIKKDVLDRLLSFFGGIDQNPQIFLRLNLPKIFSESLGTEGNIEFCILGLFRRRCNHCGHYTSFRGI